MTEQPELPHIPPGVLTLWELRQATGLAAPTQAKRFKTWLKEELAANRLVAYLSGRFGRADEPAHKGVVSPHPKGFGFAIESPREQPAFIAASSMARLLQDDIVTYHLYPGRNNKGPTAEVFAVDRPETTWLGTLEADPQGGFLLKPDRIAQPTLRVANPPEGLAPEVVVAVKVAAGTPTSDNVMTQFVSVVGIPGGPGFDTDYAIAAHQLPHVFDESVQAQLAALSPVQSRSPDRKDLRDLAFITIDGESTRDLDDAVCAATTPTGFNLKVAIADVSHYVEEATPLDREAKARATSVYFPDRVIPMLPEQLSNGLCSLNPDEDRLVLVCDMDIATDGVVRHYVFYPAVIRSRAQLTYSMVAVFAEGLRLAIQDDLHDQLVALMSTCDALEQARAATPVLPLSSKEPKLSALPDGQLHIRWAQPTAAHRFVELCMLAANHCAADLLKKSGQAALYRHHRNPTPESWCIARDNLAQRGLELPETPSLQAIADMLELARTRPDAGPIESVLLKTLQAATYDATQSAHFSLDLPRYTHFTSPIRRYPDLVVHRAIKALLKEGTAPSIDESLAAHCSLRSSQAHRAVHQVWTKLKRRYVAQHHVGSRSMASVVKITARGAKVFLQEWQTMAWLPLDTPRHWEEGELLEVSVLSGSESDILVTLA